jgi:hypothetical protein
MTWDGDAATGRDGNGKLWRWGKISEQKELLFL